MVRPGTTRLPPEFSVAFYLRQLLPKSNVLLRQCAGRTNCRLSTSPSFADAIALVRRHLWVQQGTFMPSEREHESIKVPRLLYHRMLDTLAYAA